MSTDPTPNPDVVAKSPGAPEGAFLSLPQPSQPGEVVPPIPVEFGVGLTAPDVKGHRWAILQAADGTVSVSFRIPWQLAGQIGQQIAAGLQAMMEKAASEQNGGLVVPGGGRGGGLLIPSPGQGIPPELRGQRG